MLTCTVDVHDRLQVLGRTSLIRIGDGFAHGGLHVNQEWDAHDAQGYIPSLLTAGSFHSYGDCCGPANFDNPYGSPVRWGDQGTFGTHGLWQTEHGLVSVPRTPACYLCCLNNGTSYYINFGSIATGAIDPANDHFLLDSSGNERPIYQHYKVINDRLSVRLPVPDLPLERQADRPEQRRPRAPGRADVPVPGRANTYNPRLQAAMAQRPDGKWVAHGRCNCYLRYR